MTPRTSKRDPATLLPLSSIAVQILLAVADGDKHGYAIAKEIRRRTGGAVDLGASTLYTSLRRLLGEGLIAETDERPDPALDDERRRYYVLTPFGRAVLVAEMERLDTVVADGRAKRLLPTRSRS